MLDVVGYEVDESYIAQAMQMFGRFDADGNGKLTVGEFAVLAEQLQLRELVAAVPEVAPAPETTPAAPAASAAAPAAAVAPAPALELSVEGWVSDAFQRFDTNRDGVLDQQEVAHMLDVVGYEVDESYIAQAMQMFGRFDADGNGKLTVGEFAVLAEQLQLRELVAAVPEVA
eukprot:COSAG05_NODE_10834_length_543_cov_72.740991_1_plen_171_part_01